MKSPLKGSPVLTPGWKYNLNAVKEIKVTDDFLARADKGCGIEPRENCTTRNYLEKVVNKCGCLPLSMSLGNKVN